MKSFEINAKGNYNSWPPHLLDELKKENASIGLDKNLLFENEAMRLWKIVLLPWQRIPFLKLNSNFNFLSMTSSIVIIRSSDGRIVMHHIEKQDSVYIPLENSELMYDIENVREDVLMFHLTEFKPTLSEVEPLLHESIDRKKTRKENPPK